ncbi:MAG: 1-deoxy-D-xylulose-5-phosphate synthase [Candidatus Kapabacteria bacterium]|nr:1-deoxy-D-xylulose-5-phosphate synthase [Candidatus Kapabacteria bacterium]MDW8012484.1 1-deoxy-D-xylulose-5-phosphate synthase [Bacteroidota bacterium]
MTDWTGYRYLPLINSPEDLRKLPESALRDVCAEVRRYLIDVITQVGGHFGAGLGVVELTVALHYVFNTPKDKLVWDTGHQGYPHKILTGRRDELWTIRQRGGISGFLKRSESPYDVFGAGHASTSISAALGIATARDMMGRDFKVVAIIGDGAMTGGLAYEAMNNCGLQQRDLIVILNDNRMSIAPNMWALSNYFTQIFASPLGLKARKAARELTERMDEVGDRLRRLLSRVESGVKAIITPGMLFEALGFKYFGPVNGHNVHLLVRLLRSLREMRGPVLLHVITQKGKGYAPAEQDRQNLHAIGKIDKITGKPFSAPSDKPKPPLYQTVFGQAMVELCERDRRIVGITAAMPDGTGLSILQERFPDRVFDVGIAEAHAVTFAAGLATEGMLPVCAIYSTFLQRAFDQIVHDVAIQRLHVVFALDRAGVVGQDGPTHHGMLDLAYLRIIPGMVVMAPKDEQELRNMLYSALYCYTDGPVALRYPRGHGVGVPLGPMVPLPLGKAEVLRQGEDVAIVAIGKPVMEALRAAELLKEQGIQAEVVNARFAKPLDTDLLDELCERHSLLVTVEDGQVLGGFGSAVLEYVGQRYNRRVDVMLHGIPDCFVEHATPEEQYRELRLDAQGIAQVVCEALKRHSPKRRWTRRFFAFQR